MGYLVRSVIIGWIATLMLPAQPVPGNPILQGWDRGTLLWANAAAQNSEIQAESFAAEGKKVSRIAAPFGMPAALSFQGKRACLLTRPEDGKEARLFELGSGKRWILKGKVKVEDGIAQAFPISRDKYLLASKYTLFVLGGEASPYAVGSLDGSGYLKPQRLVHLDVGLPLVQQVPTKKGGSPQASAWELTRPVGWALINIQKAVQNYGFIPFAEGGGVLLFHWPGYLFLLDENGKVRKRIELNADVDSSKLKDLFSIESVLVGAALRKDGTVLLATREKEAALQARKLHPAITRVKDPKDMNPALEYQNYKARISSFPRIVWMELDPSEGKVRRLEHIPVGAPSRFEGDLTPERFRFLVDAQDEVRIVP